MQNIVSYIICQQSINKKYGNVQVFKNICMKSKSHLMHEVTKGPLMVRKGPQGFFQPAIRNHLKKNIYHQCL